MSTPIWVSDPGERANSAYTVGTFSSPREPTDVSGGGVADASFVRRRRAMNHRV